MTRVAAIDCGTNSIRLLVADLDPERGAHDRPGCAAMEVVRLGQGVDRTGRLAPEAFERTLAALDEYAAISPRARAPTGPVGGHRRPPATPPTGRTSRGMVAGHPGRRRPRCVTGGEEAALSFVGATRLELPRRRTAPAAEPPFLVVDIGGGSTEFVARRRRPACGRRRSVDIGCVRLTERHLHGDPPTAERGRAAPRPTSGPRWTTSARRCRSPRPAPWWGWPAR